MKKNKKINNKGFSLIGLLLTMLILGIIFMVFMKKNTKKVINRKTGKMKREIKAIRKAKDANRLANITIINSAIMNYKLDHGKIPESLDELVKKNYICSGSLIDSEKKPIKYNSETGKAY